MLETLGPEGMSEKNKRRRTGARAVENFLNDGDSGRAKKERGPEEPGSKRRRGQVRGEASYRAG